MAQRNITLEKDEYYHVYNRGVDKRDIFMDEQDLLFFFHRLIDLNKNRATNYDRIRRSRQKNQLLEYSDDEQPLVQIISYALLPNHFHLILKPLVDQGIQRFMQKLCTSYVKFFNKKYLRSGALFQGRFKAKHITGNLALPNLSVYVNLNYRHHHINPQEALVKTSVFEYLGTEKYLSICSIPPFLFQEIGGKEKYQNYMNSTAQVFLEKKTRDKKTHLSGIQLFEFE